MLQVKSKYKKGLYCEYNPFFKISLIQVDYVAAYFLMHQFLAWNPSLLMIKKMLLFFVMIRGKSPPLPKWGSGLVIEKRSHPEERP